MTSIPRRLWQDFRGALASPAALVTVLVFVLGASAAIAFVPRHAAAGAATPSSQAPGDRDSEFMRYWESQPRVQVPVSSEGATVVIVKFSDYMCPSCALTHQDYKAILAKYRAQFPGDVKLVMKDYPLERECNPSMQRDMHLAACEAAVAVRLARLKGRGEAMEDWLFARNQELTPIAVRQAARDIGGVPDFDEQYQASLNQVRSDIALASILGIKVTPTFFIGHKEPGQDAVLFIRQEGGLPPQYFDMAVQYELKKAGKLK